MIVGVVALVLALGGTALAGPGAFSKITTSTIKKIATEQINAAAPTLSVSNAKTADSAKTATTATTAESAKIASNIFSANVAADGSPAGSVPSGATSTKTALGTYSVSFGRPVAGCTISASAGSSGGIDFGIVSAGVLNPTTLVVFTRTGANVVADKAFNAQMICPAG